MTEDGFPFKAPPHSREAEQSILGALLIDNQAYEHVSWLAENAFYADQHRRLWKAIARMIEAGKACDLVTVCEELGDDLGKAGGAAYIGSLAANVPSALNVRRYAELVRDKFVLRTLFQGAMGIAERALGGAEDPMTLAEEGSGIFLNLELQKDRGELVEFGAAAVEAAEWADNPSQGLPTGFPQLDGIVRGLMPGDLVIIAGRPSMGKTALAMNIAEHVAASKTAAIFSLEMTRRKIAGRALKYHESVLGRDAAMDHLQSLKLFIDDTPALTLGHLRLRLRRIQRRHGLGVVVIDYLQLLQAKAERRHEEVAVISRGLKALAKEFDVAVIAVAQLNRGTEARPDSRPMLSDLRESGQIEQDADVIAFVYRDEYYRPETEWRGIAEVIVRKNRDGAIGTAYLEFLPEYTRFRTLDRPLPVPQAPKPERARRSVVSAIDFKRTAAGDG